MKSTSIHTFSEALLLIPWRDTKLLIKGVSPPIKGLPWRPPRPHNLCSNQFITSKGNPLPSQRFSAFCFCAIGNQKRTLYCCPMSSGPS
jgi:hypothetical protein